MARDESPEAIALRARALAQLTLIEESTFSSWDSDAGNTFEREQLCDAVRMLATIIKELLA